MDDRTKKEEILTIRQLSVEFQTSKGKEQAVRDVSLSLRQGEVLALVGESGSGKTVLCRSILKLLPKNASVEGREILYHGENLLNLEERQMQKIRGQGIAMVFQDPQSALNPTMTVGSQIEEAIRMHKKRRMQTTGKWNQSKRKAKTDENADAKTIRSRGMEFLRMVGIRDAKERYDAYPQQFSGGMRQRCVLAIALALEPELLIADELTTALDVTIQKEILNLMKNLQKQLDLSILFVTHDLGVVAEISDRVAVMRKGEIVELSKTRELFTNPQHDYTKKLLADHPYYLLAKAKAAREKTVQKKEHLVEKDSPEERLVEVSHLSYAYPLGRRKWIPAVRDVSFEIRKDEIFGLVGESGSGKSTIGKCLMGILKPEAELLSYDGINLLNTRERKNNKKRLQTERQIIFQDSASSLDQRMRVEQILAEPLEIQKVFHDKKEQHQFLCKMMKEVDLEEGYLEARPPELSGGQRQRVAIARAFSMKPKLLIADEPIASLDVTTQAQMVQLFRHLQREHDCAILFIAHDLSMVRLLCDRIGVMKDGQLLEVGETAQVFEHPSHPYTKKLLEAVLIPRIEEKGEEE